MAEIIVIPAPKPVTLGGQSTYTADDKKKCKKKKKKKKY